jgi:hypothetical protein
MCDCKSLPTKVWRKYGTGACLGADAGDNLANWARQCAEAGFHRAARSQPRFYAFTLTRLVAQGAVSRKSQLFIQS